MSVLAALLCPKRLHRHDESAMSIGSADRTAMLVDVPVDERSGATAMRRVELSRPLRVAVEQGVLAPGDSVFDYGSGRGSDVAFLRQLGFNADGWDPVHAPESPISPAQVVHLGYVLNVIGDPSARSATLMNAWALAERALIVAVRSTHELTSIAQPTEHSDGICTGAETFQKLFGQLEARNYLTEQVGRDAIPLTVGTFVVFRDAGAEQAWIEHRQNARRRVPRLRRATQPSRTARDRAYEQYKQILEPLEEFILDRGRLPHEDETPSARELIEVFGSVPKAFQVIKHVAEEPWWEEAAQARRGELTVRFALSRLRRRPRFQQLPVSVQRDVKKLWGSYKVACEDADALLFSIGDGQHLRAAAKKAVVGKFTPDAVYVHVDFADRWPAPLRVLVGAAEAISGQLSDATLVKIHLDRPRVSWLMYPDFDNDPHPSLAASWVVDLRELNVRPVDYQGRANPPVLHRKELFVGEEYPRYATFKRLTSQESRHGLLDDSAEIGTRDGWRERLVKEGWEQRGHRLVRASDGYP